MGCVGGLQPAATGNDTFSASAAVQRPVPTSGQRPHTVRSAVGLRKAPQAAVPEQPAARADKISPLDRPLSDRPRRAEAKAAPKVKTLEELRRVGPFSGCHRCCLALHCLIDACMHNFVAICTCINLQVHSHSPTLYQLKGMRGSETFDGQRLGFLVVYVPCLTVTLPSSVPALNCCHGAPQEKQLKQQKQEQSASEASKVAQKTSSGPPAASAPVSPRPLRRALCGVAPLVSPRPVALVASGR